MSGRALFSMLLPADFQYKKGEVVIIDGVLINGNITKKDIGTSRNSIVQVLHMDYGSEWTSTFLTDASRVLNRWFSTYGFSIGLESCTHTDPKLIKLKDEQMALMKMMVMQAGAKMEDPIAEEHRQREILAYLNKPVNMSMKLISETFGIDNALARMIISGSKGSVFNAGQIAFALGMQYSGGKPIPWTLTNQSRALPTFEPYDPDPIAHGFAINSFSEGLTPSEMFFHGLGSRDNIIDTAIKTAPVGKLSRDMNMALADYVTQYDGSVRNSNGQILQSIYGNDGFNPAYLTLLNVNGDDIPFFMDVTRTIKRLNQKYDNIRIIYILF
uniref:DNA-directed RNA polymerase n=1 Tax=Pithovirus LCPAC102 TaxID=2506587 RepID=A0A481Z3X0_9VIRU|nr:MAG: DNA-directed RNA polymerase subunit alpha [Pithovirus LCPAC102]